LSSDADNQRSIPPPIQAVVDYLETQEVPAGEDWVTYLAGFDAIMNAVSVPIPTPEELVIREVSGWRVKAAIWSPTGDGPHPVVLHLHGGGWTSGNHLSHRGFAAELVAQGFLVMAVDYRRAPKHRFPAAFDDALFALEWCSTHIAQFHGDPSRIALVGDSAGANLASAVLATQDGIAVAGALLFGIYDYQRTFSELADKTGPSVYVTPTDLAATSGDPRLSPIHAVDRLPVCYVSVGGHDTLLGEGRRLHEAMTRAGVRHFYHEIPGAPHSYIQLPGHPDYQEGIDGVVAFLRYVLNDDEAALSVLPNGVEGPATRA
jgi:acetyl esterase